MPEFKYSVEDCDVDDKEALVQYREKRLNWLVQFDEDEHHAIWPHIWELLWRDHIFRVVNEARRIASETKDPSVGFNSAVSRMLDVGFVTTQATAIRRLATADPSGRPERAVISLRSILDDIEASREFITRENYVCYDGLPYDVKAVHDEWLQGDEAKFGSTMPNEVTKAWLTAKIAHERFDELSGVSANERSRGDLIRPGILSDIRGLLDECEPVCEYANKFVAHAADPYSRSQITEEDQAITLDKLEGCYKKLYQVAHFIYCTVLWQSDVTGGLPTPQYDHLENLDKPWATSETLDQLRSLYDEHSDQIDQWPRELVLPSMPPQETQ